jgi:4-hydroxybenzoate polyprenyltransferase
MPITKDTIKLLRIPFSFFLMPIFLLVLSQVASKTDMIQGLLVFFIIHLLVYPASNGYNSYIDQDEGSIGGLERPPKPTKSLLYVTFALDGLALILSALFVNHTFAFMILAYILASRAYSSSVVRLKKYAFIGFLTVVFFQGAFTYSMVYTGLTGEIIDYGNYHKFILLASSFQIAGAYPLTQIYQHEADLKDGVVTLSYKLGYQGTFLFTMIMFLMCNICYFLYFFHIVELTQFVMLQLLFLPVVTYFGYWFLKVRKNTANADFKHTMRMNLISAVCMNLCFTLFFIMNLNK